MNELINKIIIIVII